MNINERIEQVKTSFTKSDQVIDNLLWVGLNLWMVTMSQNL